MKRRMTVFCIQCGKDVVYTVCAKRVETIIRDVKISYVELTAKCPVCGEEVYVPEINDANVQSREDAYRTAMHIITKEEIEEILEKYNIGAGPLAKVLGVGDVTINRYLLGQLPSKAISERLYMIKADRKYMRECLEQNKEKITIAAYEKCIKALDDLDALLGTSKIELVTRYILSRSFDITPLALQKLLYYAQAFFHAIFGDELFIDDCQAWAYGPVYPDVYYRYKPYGYDPIMISPDDSQTAINSLTAKEKSFLDAIVHTFGYYSGTVLRDFTHSEQPWLEARGNLRPEDRCMNIISRDTINSYFDTMAKKYGITDPQDIGKYCAAKLNKVG